MKKGLFVSCMRAIDDSVGGGRLEDRGLFTATNTLALAPRLLILKRSLSSLLLLF